MTNAPPQPWHSLQSAVRRARLNYSKLAELAGTSRQSISAYANGRRCPSDETVALLAEILDVPVEELRVGVPLATTSPEEMLAEVNGMCAALDEHIEMTLSRVREIKAKRAALQQLVQVPA